MRVVLCTCPPDAAERIARALVEAGAACVNILPAVRSIYRWKGQICDEGESLLVIKVASEQVPAVEQKMRATHPYELPEWVVLPTDELLTSREYRSWVRDAVG
jgi:periplasmic divalent cation tolerance protein